MALSLDRVDARAPWRIRAFFSGGSPAGQPANAFVLTRIDGGANTAKIINAFSPDVAEIELVVSEALIPGVVYAVTWSAMVALCMFNVPPEDLLPDVAEDIGAELFGIDLDWLFGVPDADGDCPRRSGSECLVHDLGARSLLKKSELIHLPTKGANLMDTVNGPASPAEQGAIQGTLEAEFRDDDRVADASVDVSESDAPAGFNFNARITPVAIGGTLKVSNT